MKLNLSVIAQRSGVDRDDVSSALKSIVKAVGECIKGGNRVLLELMVKLVSSLI